MERRNNIVLIGMPAAGKSTVGVLLAKAINKDFVDTDVVIQQKQGKALQELVDNLGLTDFCKLEAEYVQGINCVNTVIATGGSVPYSKGAMEHLKENGIVIYLKISVEKIRQRLTNFDTRGLVIDKGETLEELYAERAGLYERYADITVGVESSNHQQVIDIIIKSMPL